MINRVHWQRRNLGRSAPILYWKKQSEQAKKNGGRDKGEILFGEMEKAKKRTTRNKITKQTKEWTDKPIENTREINMEFVFRAGRRAGIRRRARERNSWGAET